MYIYIYVYIYLCIYIYVYIYIYMCVCVYIYIHRTSATLLQIDTPFATLARAASCALFEKKDSYCIADQSHLLYIYM